MKNHSQKPALLCALLCAAICSGCGTSGSTSTALEPPVPCNGARLTWAAPTHNTDGSALTDLSGYLVSWGTAPGVYTQTQTVAGAVDEVNLSGLSDNTAYYFVVQARATNGAMSAYSNEGTKSIPDCSASKSLKARTPVSPSQTTQNSDKGLVVE